MIRAGSLLAAVVAAAVAAGPARAATVTPPSSQRFSFVDSRQDFTVPAGVHQVHLSVWGGGGGSGGYESGLYAAPGGLGANLDLDAAVNPGDVLFIEVGAQGGNAAGRAVGVGGHSSGSSENGGPGGTLSGNGSTHGTAGGGGGGGTTVVDAADPGTPLLIAGGGGGGGGGGLVAGYNGGQGGDAGSATKAACDPANGPGVFGSGLTGGAGGSCSPAQMFSVGGSGGGNAGDGAGSGGGGGGGYHGGGGGASGGASGGGGGGGGAGTSFWSDATSGVQVTNGVPGNGGVIVSWTPSLTGGIAHKMDFAGCCASQTFTVPDNVTQLTVTGRGGSGGLGGGTADGLIAPRGGFGSVITALVPVTPGDKLLITAGGAGGN
ncbi:MAG TPA: hypothetical protein VI300_28610, partial [Solirubrobacter sp.]